MRIFNVLKFVLDSIINRLFFGICIIVMGAIGFVMINSSVTQNYRRNIQYIDAKKLYDNSNMCVIKPTLPVSYEEYISKYNNAFEQVRQIEGVDYIGTFEVMNGNMPVNGVMGGDVVILMDEGVINARELKLKEGSMDSFCIASDEIPVVIGCNKGKAVKVGDTISRKENDKIYRVMGILEAGAMWFSENGMRSTMERSVSLDDAIITLALKEDNIYNHNEMYLGITKGYEKSEVIARVQNVLKENGIIVDIMPAKQSVTAFRDESKEELDVYNMIMFFFVGVAIIGTSSVSAVYVIMKKQDFGIMYSVGISQLDILKMIYIENLIKVSISAVAGYYISKRSVYNISYYSCDNTLYEMYTGIYRWILVALVAIISVLSTLVPYIIFRKQKVSQLIGGERE